MCSEKDETKCEWSVLHKQLWSKLSYNSNINLNLINFDNEENMYGFLNVDYMYIKCWLGWDINQSKCIEVDRLLSYDVVTNEFFKVTDNTVDSNQNFTNE